ncbi:hypothetical protein A8950_1903 [Dongia mobilis]|uniref:Uncharacterized protein n=1 Tax=Dongia mobilis TaxID=578943 RepID=A0A4R6WMI8_9PROT|nr:hypothetical protein [Dongia mobilis]TDQ82083.1 hypothetical protein A8950_1903 [Dongia mobilis]
MPNDHPIAFNRPAAGPTAAGPIVATPPAPGPATSGDSAKCYPGAIDAGLAFDILPWLARRQARFGSDGAARLAELHARRHEIDGISRRLAAAAQDRCRDVMAAEVQGALRQLRQASLTLLAEIARSGK